MALPRPSAPALAVLPALALLPVLITVLAGIHAGGVEIWMAFLSAAVHPSLDPLLLKALLRALQVTLAMALAGWSLSLVLGVLLGCFASERLMQTWRWPTWPAWILRRSLALPRSVHELIWGLLLLQVLHEVALRAAPHSVLGRFHLGQDALQHLAFSARPKPKDPRLRDGNLACLEQLQRKLFPLSRDDVHFNAWV